MKKEILLIAGEVSGDMHAARLVREIQACDSSIHFFGIGGDRLRETGMEIVHDVREMAVMGLSEVLLRYFFFRRVFNEMCELITTRKPAAVLLVDYPGFNLRLAREAHRMGVKVMYYICPQVWAWKRSRIKKMAKIIDHLLVIFPFEKEVFRKTLLDVHYVGHPLVEDTEAALLQEKIELPWLGQPRLSLLPGSRKQEITRILPVMLETAKLLEEAYPDLGVVVASAGVEATQSIRDILSQCVVDSPKQWEIVEGQVRQVVKQADAAMVASGTATLETALMKCPMVVVYKTAWLTYEVGKRVVKVPHIGMVNLVAGHELCPEFIQNDAEPVAMAKVMKSLLTDTEVRRGMLKGVEGIREKLAGERRVEDGARIVVGSLNGEV